MSAVSRRCYRSPRRRSGRNPADAAGPRSGGERSCRDAAKRCAGSPSATARSSDRCSVGGASTLSDLRRCRRRARSRSEQRRRGISNEFGFRVAFRPLQTDSPQSLDQRGQSRSRRIALEWATRKEWSGASARAAKHHLPPQEARRGNTRRIVAGRSEDSPAKAKARSFAAASSIGYSELLGEGGTRPPRRTCQRRP